MERETLDAIKKIDGIEAVESCGCVGCDLGLEVHHDKIGFYHVSKGARVPCPFWAGLTA